MCFGCSVTTPGSRATHTYTRARVCTQMHTHVPRTLARARSRRSFAITYHYSAWLLELQPRAMFATRLPCAILLLHHFSSLPPLSRACSFSPAPATYRHPLFSAVSPRSAIPPRSYSSTLAISNYSAEPVAPGALQEHIFDILHGGRGDLVELNRVSGREESPFVLFSPSSSSSHVAELATRRFRCDASQYRD